MTKKDQKSPPEEVSPAVLLQRDLQELRKDFRATIRKYVAQVEGDIGELLAQVEKQVAAKKLSQERMRDYRDISAALRKLKLKPEKGRRKDLKKVDLLVADLKDLASGW